MKEKLLLHACCAPCLTAVYERLKKDFEVTIFWFNPNIAPDAEYFKRLEELEKYADLIKVPVIIGDKYFADNLSWNNLTKKYSQENEGGKRCELCIKYRLLATAKYASENNFALFCTTLTVSPHKNAKMINDLGQAISTGMSEVKFYEADFKKNDGYKQSIELSKKFKIYRQNYCGCQYSLESSNS